MLGRAVCFGLERQDVIGRWVCGDLKEGRLLNVVLRCRENCPASGPTFGGICRALSAYQRFETTVALLLTVVISCGYRHRAFPARVHGLEALIIRSLNPLEHEVFQLVFGGILTLLIALEFNHTLQYEKDSSGTRRSR